MKLSTAIALLAGVVAQVAYAAPSNEARDVFNPQILNPHRGTVWHSGEKHNVRWSLEHEPRNITNANNGIISLRFDGVTTPVILAHGFDVRAGHVQVTVPDVFTRKDFSVVFFGDGSDISQQFTIIGPEA